MKVVQVEGDDAIIFVLTIVRSHRRARHSHANQPQLIRICVALPKEMRRWFLRPKLLELFF